MARRKSKRRVKKFKGINIVDAGLGYAGLSVWTQAAFGLDPISFVRGDTKSPAGATLMTYAYKANKISLREIFDGIVAGGPIQGHTKTELQLVGDNLSSNWMTGLWQSALIAGAGTVGKRVTRKPRAFVNKTLRNFGLGDMVRV